jgi:hypothetical protein
LKSLGLGRGFFLIQSKQGIADGIEEKIFLLSHEQEEIIAGEIRKKIFFST